MPSILFDLGASSVEPLAVFRDNEHLEKTKTEVTDGFMTCPYAISKVPDILAVADGKDVKSSQGVFHVQFSMSDQVKKTKHGQYPMQTSKNDALRELALTQGPKVATIKMTGPAAKEQIAVRRFITSCSHFGFMPQCVINGEVERFAMPSYRYQLKGRREVLFVSYDDLSRFFPMEAICSKINKNLLEALTDVISTMSLEVATDFVQAGVKIYRGEVQTLIVTNPNIVHIGRRAT